MAEHTREENNDAKSLKRVLKQVDRRVVVPESLSYENLRALIEDVEPVTVREKRLPSWLSPQSGLAYAAAFCLIVALVYSTGTYKPDIITGGMAIPPQSSSERANPAKAAPPADIMPEEESAHAENAVLSAPAQATVPDSPAEAVTLPESPTPNAAVLGVGGGNRSTLLVKDNGFEYRWRPSNAADPDHSGYISLEVIDSATQEIANQIDIDAMLTVSLGFISEDSLALVGSFEGNTVVNTYSTAPGLSVTGFFEQPGTLVDARIYNGVLHVVSLSATLPEDIEVTALPDSVGGTETCVITALDLGTLNYVRQAFSGASGAIQLGDSTVIIHYGGHLAPIFLAGTNIELDAAMLG